MASAEIVSREGTKTINLDVNQTITLSPGERFELPPDVIPVAVVKTGEQLVIILENNVIIQITDYFSLNVTAEVSPIVALLGEEFTPPDFETTLGLSHPLNVIDLDVPGPVAGLEKLEAIASSASKELQSLLIERRELSETLNDAPYTFFNSPPDAVDDFYAVHEDTHLMETILSNDSDPEGQPIRVVDFSKSGVPMMVEPYGHFSLNLLTVPQFQSLAPGEEGTFAFDYTIADSFGLTDSATVTLLVTGENDVPIVSSDDVTTEEDVPVAIDVLNNDTEVDNGQTLVVVGVDTSGTEGTVTIPSDGQEVIYNPTGFDSLAAGETATDSFLYTVADDVGATATGMVTVTVTGANDAPTAADDSVVMPNDGTNDASILPPTTTAVLDNDHDPDATDSLSIIAIDTTGTTGGTVVVNSDNTITYTPTVSHVSLASGEVFTDSYIYTISDDQGATASATVTYTVIGDNDEPIANEDSMSTDGDTVTTINVLTNDSDPEGGALSLVGADSTTPEGATVTTSADGTVTYDPTTSSHLVSLAPNTTATDSFTVTVSDDEGVSSTSVVVVTISTGDNDDPIAVADTGATDEDTVLTVAAPGVLSNDSDPDADAFSVMDADSVSGLGASVAVSSTGAYTYDPTGSSTLQALDSGDVVTDSFTYTITDAYGATASSTVTITVTGANDVPVANDDTGTTTETAAVSIPVLNNDVDVDSHHTLSVVADTQGAVLGGSVQVEGDRIVYTPSGQNSLSSGEVVTDSYTYTVFDEHGASDSATVVVTIVGENDAPVANDNLVVYLNDGSYGTMPLLNPISSDIVSDDEDPDAGDNLRIIGLDTSGITGGAVTLLSDTTVNYEPTVSHISLAAGEVFVDTLVYTISDNFGATDSATVGYTVLGDNDAPIANADVNATHEDTPITGNVLANDNEFDNFDSITVSSMDSVSTLGASVTTDPAGNYTYDPTGSATLQGLDSGDVVTDSFTYTIADSFGVTSSTTVTITVTGVHNNAPPMANSDNNATNEDSIVMGNVLTNDTDPDVGDPLTVIGGSSVSALGAVITMNSSGDYSYDPRGSSALNSLSFGEVMTDSFTYTISDGSGATDSATVTITVAGANDAPIANDDTGTTTETAAVTIPVLSNDVDVDRNDTLRVEADPRGAFLGGNVRVDGNRITYTPSGQNSLSSGEVVTDSYTYTVFDNHGASDSATVVVTIVGENDAPVAHDNAVIYLNDGFYGNTPILNPISSDIVLNDEDPDAGDNLRIVGIDTSGIRGGIVTLLSDTAVNYEPTVSHISLAAGEVFVDTLVYTISDNFGATDSATVGYTVLGDNDAPIANSDTNTTNEDTAITGNVLANDNEFDNFDSITVSSMDSVSSLGALVTTDSAGNYAYDPRGSAVLQALDRGETAIDSFTYTIADSFGVTSSTTVSITVTGVDDVGSSPGASGSAPGRQGRSSESVVMDNREDEEERYEESHDDYDDDTVGCGSHSGYGTGFNVLRLDEGDVDFTQLSDDLYTDFDGIELALDNQKVTLDPIDVISMSSNHSKLFIGTDNSNTTVNSGAVWARGGTSTVDGVIYNVFTSDGATLLVEQDIDSSGLL